MARFLLLLIAMANQLTHFDTPLAFARRILAAWALMLLLSLASGGCSASCTVDGHDYADGMEFTCADGCNFCVCDDGTISKTHKGCPSPPGSAALKLICKDGDAAFMHGDSWDCRDGCGQCACDDGLVERTDTDTCSEGAAGGS